MTDPEIRLRVTKIPSDDKNAYLFRVEDFDGGQLGALSDVSCQYPMHTVGDAERIGLWSAGILSVIVPYKLDTLYWKIPKTAESVDTDRGDWDITLANQFYIAIYPSLTDSLKWVSFDPYAEIGTEWTYPPTEDEDEEEPDSEYLEYPPAIMIPFKCSAEEETTTYTIHTTSIDWGFLGQVCYWIDGHQYWFDVEVFTSEEGALCPCHYFRFKTVEGAVNYRGKFVNFMTGEVVEIGFYPQNCVVDPDRAVRYGVKPEKEDSVFEEVDVYLGGFEHGFTSKISFITDTNRLVIHIIFRPSEKKDYQRLKIVEAAFYYDNVLTTYPVTDCEFNIDTSGHQAIVFLTVTNSTKLTNHSENAYDFICRGLLFEDTDEIPEYQDECRLLGWFRPYETPLYAVYENDATYPFSPDSYEPTEEEKVAVRQAAAQYAQQQPQPQPFPAPQPKKWYQKLMYIRRCRLRRDLRRLFIK